MFKKIFHKKNNAVERKIAQEAYEIQEKEIHEINRYEKLCQAYTEYRYVADCHAHDNDYVLERSFKNHYYEGVDCSRTPEGRVFTSLLAETKTEEVIPFIDALMKDRKLSGYELARLLVAACKRDLCHYILDTYDSDNPRYMGVVEYFADTNSFIFDFQYFNRRDISKEMQDRQALVDKAENIKMMQAFLEKSDLLEDCHIVSTGSLLQEGSTTLTFSDSGLEAEDWEEIDAAVGATPKKTVFGKKH